jgi:hypothetical protein
MITFNENTNKEVIRKCICHYVLLKQENYKYILYSNKIKLIHKNKF